METFNVFSFVALGLQFSFVELNSQFEFEFKKGERCRKHNSIAILIFVFAGRW